NREKRRQAKSSAAAVNSGSSVQNRSRPECPSAPLRLRGESFLLEVLTRSGESVAGSCVEESSSRVRARCAMRVWLHRQPNQYEQRCPRNTTNLDSCRAELTRADQTKHGSSFGQ